MDHIPEGLTNKSRSERTVARRFFRDQAAHGGRDDLGSTGGGSFAGAKEGMPKSSRP